MSIGIEPFMSIETLLRTKIFTRKYQVYHPFHYPCTLGITYSGLALHTIHFITRVPSASHTVVLRYIQSIALPVYPRHHIQWSCVIYNPFHYPCTLGITYSGLALHTIHFITRVPSTSHTVVLLRDIHSESVISAKKRFVRNDALHK